PAGRVSPPGSALNAGPGTSSPLPLRSRPREAAAGMTPDPVTGSGAASRAPEPGRGRAQTPAREGRPSSATRAGTNPIAAAMSEADLLSNVTSGTRKRP